MFSVLGAFENTVVGTSLVVGGFCSIIIISTLLTILDRQVSVPELCTFLDCGNSNQCQVHSQFYSFAWTINRIVGDMQTGKYLSSLVSGNIPMQFFCLLYFFVLGAAMSVLHRYELGEMSYMLPIADCNGRECCTSIIASLFICSNG